MTHTNHYARKLFLVMGLSLMGPALLAMDSPVGKWRTIDDQTGKPRSIVQISEKDGKLYGKSLELIDPEEPNPKCRKCPGDSKDKPVVGLTILWDMKKAGNEWSGGKILDPKNGKVYKCSLRLKD